MDQINLSDIRAKFPEYADVPDATLLGALHKKYYSDIPRADFLQSINFDTHKQDPTAGNSFLENAAIGVGRGMTGVMRALGGGPIADSLGLPGTKEEAERLDAPLMKTAGGKVGNVVGQAALAAPVALVPGANTYLGAGILGGLTGAAFTEGDAMDRLKGGIGGAVGGVAGKGAGDLIGWGVPKLVDSLAAKRAIAQTANAQRDAAAVAAKDAGFVIPPSDVNPSMLNEALGGLSGKVKTAQVASARNQDVTNQLAKRALGIAEDAPLTSDALDAVRKQAGAAYSDISKLGSFDATKANLPAGVRVTESNSPLLFGKQKSVDMGDAVNAWRQYNADATAYFRSYARTADPEALTKARAAAAAAKQVDDFIANQVAAYQQAQPGKLIGDLSSGKVDLASFIKQTIDNGTKGNLVENLKAARQQIAKSYTVEKALNGTTGDVSAQALAKELAKGKPLSGDLLTIAQAAQAFPKATQALKEAPKAVSPLDYAMALMGAGSTGPAGAAAIAARPTVRSLLLSKAYQGLLANPQSYEAGLLESALPALNSSLVRKPLPFGGGLLGVELSQQ